MEKKLYDSEFKIMDILWQRGELSAKEIAGILRQEIGWSKTTTYTVIKKCVDKGIINKSYPNYMCRACISKEEVRQYETQELIAKMYNGYPDQLVASVINSENLDEKMIQHLKELVKDL